MISKKIICHVLSEKTNFIQILSTFRYKAICKLYVRITTGGITYIVYIYKYYYLWLLSIIWQYYFNQDEIITKIDVWGAVKEQVRRRVMQVPVCGCTAALYEFPRYIRARSFDSHRCWLLVDKNTLSRNEERIFRSHSRPFRRQEPGSRIARA